MSGTLKSDSSLYAELPDNTSGEILPVDIRDVVASKLSVFPTIVAAAGSTQGTATVLTAMFNVVTSGTGGVVAQASTYTKIWNAIAVPINVYPPSSAAINGLSVNTPIQVGAGASLEVTMVSSVSGYAV